MMVCPTSEPTGPILYMLDPDTFTSVGSGDVAAFAPGGVVGRFRLSRRRRGRVAGRRTAAADHARPAHRLPALRSDRRDVADGARKKRRAQQRERERRAAVPGKQGEDPGKRAVVEDNQGDGAGELQGVQHPQRRPAAQPQQGEIGDREPARGTSERFGYAPPDAPVVRRSGGRLPAAPGPSRPGSS